MFYSVFKLALVQAFCLAALDSYALPGFQSSWEILSDDLMASSEVRSRPREPCSVKKVSKTDFLQIIYD